MGKKGGGGRAGFMKAARSAKPQDDDEEEVQQQEQPQAPAPAPAQSKAAAFLKDPEPAAASDSDGSDEEGEEGGVETRGKMLQRHKRVRRRRHSACPNLCQRCALNQSRMRRPAVPACRSRRR